MSAVLSAAAQVRHSHALGFHFDDLRDFEFRLVVQGDPFVLKNSKQIIVLPGRRPILVPSKAAKQYLNAATMQLRALWGSVFREPLPEHIQLNAAIRSYLSTRRRSDASNCYQAPEDAMQAAGVIVDDYQIRTHNGSDRLHDPENPRVEITLTPYRPINPTQE